MSVCLLCRGYCSSSSNLLLQLIWASVVVRTWACGLGLGYLVLDGLGLDLCLGLDGLGLGLCLGLDGLDLLGSGLD